MSRNTTPNVVRGNGKPMFNIGVLGPMAYDRGKYYENAFAAITAKLDFESDDPILPCPGCNERFGVRLIFADDNVTSDDARKGALDLMLGDRLTTMDFEPVVALMGGQVPETCASSAEIGHVLQVPQVAWGCAVQVGVTGQYPFFARTHQINFQFAVAEVAMFFHWQRFTIVFEPEEEFSAHKTEDLMLALVRATGKIDNNAWIKQVRLERLKHADNRADLEGPDGWHSECLSALNQMNNVWFTVLGPQTSTEFFPKAIEWNITHYYQQWVVTSDSLGSITRLLNAGYRNFMGAIIVSPLSYHRPEDGHLALAFSSKLQKYGRDSYSNSETSFGIGFDLMEYAVQTMGEAAVKTSFQGLGPGSNWEQNHFWPLVYDAFYTFIYAINSLLEGNVTVAQIRSFEGPQLLRDAVSAVEFNGASKQVRFEDGWRPGDWSIDNVQANGVGWQCPRVGSLETGVLHWRESVTITFMDGLQWFADPGNLSHAPRDRLPRCPDGHMRDKTGACHACEPGKFANEETWLSRQDPHREDCIPCDFGWYSEVSGASQCKACPAGSDSGRSIEMNLPERKLKAHEGEGGKEGEYSEEYDKGSEIEEEEVYNEESAEDVVKMQGPEDSEQQLEKLPGDDWDEDHIEAKDHFETQGGDLRLWGAPAFASCTLCKAGTSAQIGTSCTSCPEGTFAPNAGSASCEFAPAGFFVNTTGATEATQCPHGEVASHVGAQSCSPCQRGEYANDTKGCERCPRGSFSNEDGSTACISCADTVGYLRTTDFLGATSSAYCVCPDGFFATSGTLACVECETGMTCAFGSDLANYWESVAESDAKGERVTSCSDTTLTKPYPCLNPGYFAFPDRPTYVYLCQSEDICPGDAPAGVLPCKTGFEGINCGRCANDLYMDRNECRSCEGGDLAMAPVAVTLAMAMAGLLHWSWNRKTAHVEAVESVLASVTFGTTIAFMQTLGIFSRLSLRWPPDFKAILDAMSVIIFDFELLRISCIVPESLVMRFFTSMLLPIVVTVCFGSWHLISRLLHLIFGEKFQTFSWSSIFNSIGLVLLALFISIVSTTVSFFDCYESPNGKSTLRVYPYVVCRSDEYYEAYPLAIFGVIVYLVGFSGLMAWLLWIAPQNYHIPSFRTGVRFLVFKFRPSIWYWNLIIVVRSLLIAMVSIMEPNDAWIQFLLMLIFLIGGLVLHLLFQPYLDRYANILETTELSFLIIIMAIGSWFLTEESRDHPEKESVMSVLLISSVVSCFLILFSVFCWALYLAAFPDRAHDRLCAAIKPRIPKLRAAYDILTALPDDKLIEFLAKLAHSDRKTLFDAAHITTTQHCGYQGQYKHQQSLLPQQRRFSYEEDDKLERMRQKSVTRPAANAAGRDVDASDSTNVTMFSEASGKTSKYTDVTAASEGTVRTSNPDLQALEWVYV